MTDIIFFAILIFLSVVIALLGLMAVKTLKTVFLNFSELYSTPNFFRELLYSLSNYRIHFNSSAAEINMVSAFIFYLLLLKFQLHEFSYYFIFSGPFSYFGSF